jgi:hypothetical protein
MIKENTFEEQFYRLKRWYQRLEMINNNQIKNFNSTYHYEDEFYAFFLNCYHLKDWIKNDESIISKGDVEDFINKNNCLRICADICNGQKHLKLHRTRSECIPKLGKRDLHFEYKKENPSTWSMIGMKFYIKTEIGIIDAFELASDCMEKWQEFIEKKINIET